MTTPSDNPAPDAVDEFVIRVLTGAGEISDDQWAALGGASRAPGKTYNPFVSKAFLVALEESGCVSAKTGWMPQHLALETSGGALLGFCPAYVKSHSQGEYVFDHAWADAYERAGGRYYPKLQVSVPFTPATGPRLLVREHANEDAVRTALGTGIKQLTDQAGLSSAHITFGQMEEVTALERLDFLHRTDQQFHFTNDQYADYDAFLDTLSSRKRKNLKKERAQAVSNGIEIEWLSGHDITSDAMDAFYGFYTDTGNRKWGRPYLNRAFYEQIQHTMADDILLIMAKRGGRYVAGAINFIGGDTLFGRHWGCVEHHPFLHFEVCYHQAIDFAIARGLKTVEAGAQGEHKLARGYVPVTTHSAHYLPDPGFRRAVADYLEHERADVARFGEILKKAAPFKKTDGG